MGRRHKPFSSIYSNFKSGLKKCSVHIREGCLAAWNSLLAPSSFFDFKWKASTGFPLLGSAAVFLILGVMLNHFWAFPNFYFFVIAFSIIVVAVFFALKYFFHSMDLLCNDVAPYAPFTAANKFYLIDTQKSLVYLVFPLFFIGAFGIGGSIIYSEICFTPTFIWCLVYFIIIVYLSMLAYLQYIRFAYYLYRAAHNTLQFGNIITPDKKELPPNLTWLIHLTKISHMLRNMFFLVGASYIVAFAVFCFSPIYGIRIDDVLFYGLWIIIFVCIVLAFPLVTAMNISSIKKLVTKAKDAFVSELLFEQQLIPSEEMRWATKLSTIMRNHCISIILKTPDYPVKGYLNIAYSVVAALINLSASIATILQYQGWLLF